jgi:voltage-gated potassium channel
MPNRPNARRGPVTHRASQASGAGYAAVEKGQHLSTWDGVWWAIVTVTTVGYGDSDPHTDGGRVIAIVVMLVGIGFIAILTAAAAERFVRGQRSEQRELEGVERRLDEVLRRLETIDARERA